MGFIKVNIFEVFLISPTKGLTENWQDSMGERKLKIRGSDYG